MVRVYMSEHDLDRAKGILNTYVPVEVPEKAYNFPQQENEEEELKRFDDKYKRTVTVVGVMFYILIMIRFLN